MKYMDERLHQSCEPAGDSADGAVNRLSPGDEPSLKRAIAGVMANCRTLFSDFLFFIEYLKQIPKIRRYRRYKRAKKEFEGI